MKKLPENDPLRLRHMLEAAQKLQRFTAEKSREDLEGDEILGLAVVRLFEIIGEAASQVTDETKSLYPAVRWSDIVGMRNRIIHGYFNVDMGLVWETINSSIPELIDQLRPLVTPTDDE